MRKNILVALLGIGMLLLAGIAGADPIILKDTTIFTVSNFAKSEDYNSHGGGLNRLDGSFDYVSWTHHYVINPLAEEVLDSSRTRMLHDDSDSDSFEFAFGWAEDGTWGLGEEDIGDYTYDINASYLEDGSFSVALASLWGDFYIDKSVLEITYNPVDSSASSAPVPEPASMLLLGSGLIGISFVGRKKLFKG